MKGYRFSLESVLRVRRFEKMLQAQKLAEASCATLAACRTFETLRDQLEQDDKLAARAASAADALRHRQALVVLRERGERARAGLEEAHETEKKAREAVKEAWRREKSLEKLQAREHVLFLSNQEAVDRLAADDFVNALYYRANAEDKQ
ncbi:hypothetical protein H5P28_12150 [Ruficoccus amylovorans]|uniref:Flagellar FliJ protein n=1 Tax=Ruficoccus amylovorans TaxID=1804625 RepID=A0A842HFL9_9BACT|nr:hypothetical protein [Ruficoccus amylovorans]MBC2595010.1 hypothetical protein [Ruficoccus amylovorans]